ncbi:MAG: NADH-quinone oxidoreductase subunit J [Planctomycetes bacterium]|nr:NADH-quinone oxidoreductase subunit J [Planctomycetota bacterium]
MSATFYVAGAVAIASTAMVISRRDAVHALLYLVVSFLSLATVFLTLGAPFIAALEVILYAGAIVVLFVFVVTMLNPGSQETQWRRPRAWIGPSILTLVLAGELVVVMARGEAPQTGGAVTTPREAGLALFGPYLLGVEAASMLLLAGLVGAFHLGRKT